MVRKKLGEVLVETGAVTREQLELALARAGNSRLGEALIELGYLSHDKLGQAVAAQFGLPYASLKDLTFQPEAVKLLNGETARRCQVVPIGVEGRTLRLGISDPLNVLAIDDVTVITGYTVSPVVMSAPDIQKALARLYPDLEVPRAEEPPAGEAAAPAVRLVSQIISQAIRERASDIHLEPQERDVRVRFRIDGIMHEITHLDKDLLPPVASRIKILAGLDISERRLPQDGGFRCTHEGQSADLRVSTLPTVLGEKIAIRVLSVANSRLRLDEIGLLPGDLAKFQNMLRSSHGMILVTGPTGSGKTTTMYSALDVLHTPYRNIIAVEDPVEYHVPGINQVQVNPRIGLTYAAVLRALVRQDPDVIMVGEIRDLETADMAIRAALTGHLVLSSLHTNDGPSTITRLMEMGIEPYLIASSVRGIVAQRLIRRLCPRCHRPASTSEWALEMLALRLEPCGDVQFHRPGGCDFCGGEGYRGRIGVFEVLTVDETLRELIVNRAGTNQIRDAARARGTRSFREDGIEKAKAGLTTLEEVVRVSYQDD